MNHIKRIVKSSVYVLCFFLVCACGESKSESDQDNDSNKKNSLKDEIEAINNREMDPDKISLDLDSMSKMLEQYGVSEEMIADSEFGEFLDNATKAMDGLMEMQTVDKSSMLDEDLDQLTSLILEHPQLQEDEAIVITDTEVQINFLKLSENLSDLDDSDLAQISKILQKNSIKKEEEKAKNPFKGSIVEEQLLAFTYKDRAKNRKLYNDLRSASPEEADQKLAEHYGIKPEEVALLQKIDKQEVIRTEKQAEALVNPKYEKEVEVALKDPSTSSKFKTIVQNHKNKQSIKAERVIKHSTQARENFYRLNPGWHGDGEHIGNTYVDSQNKMIYLPFGDLSFADVMIDFKAGQGGQHPMGALGEPNTNEEDFTKPMPSICNIGTNGILTLQFTDNAITDVNGPDLYVFEMGKIEPTMLELSNDGENWLKVGKIDGGTAMVDIAEFVEKGQTFTYVRLTDLRTRSGVPGADVDAVAAIGGAMRLQIDSAVLFEFGKYDLKDEAEEVIKELIPQILSINEGTIVIEGHTDNVGSPSSNKQLSLKRAKSVSSLLKTLMKNDVAKFDWRSKGHGESQPVALNDSDENRQKNRRVEILIIPK